MKGKILRNPKCKTKKNIVDVPQKKKKKIERLVASTKIRIAMTITNFYRKDEKSDEDGN